MLRNLKIVKSKIFIVVFLTLLLSVVFTTVCYSACTDDCQKANDACLNVCNQCGGGGSGGGGSGGGGSGGGGGGSGGGGNNGGGCEVVVKCKSNHSKRFPAELSCSEYMYIDTTTGYGGITKPTTNDRTKCVDYCKGVATGENLQYCEICEKNSYTRCGPSEFASEF